MARRSWRLAVLAALPLAVVVFDPAGFDPFGPAKWAVESVLFPLGLVAVWRGRGRGLRVERRTMVLWAAFLAVVTLAAVFGVDRGTAWTGTPERHFGVFTWLLCGWPSSSART